MNKRRVLVPSDYKIRRATRRDIDTLVLHRRKMWEEIYRSSGRRGRPKISDSQYRRWLLEMIAGKRFFGFIAVKGGGTILGSGGIFLRDAHPRPGVGAALREPYLLSMYTDEEFRGAGVASAIVKESVAWAKKKGYRSMRLHASRAGRRVYSSLGWQRTWEMKVDL